FSFAIKTSSDMNEISTFVMSTIGYVIEELRNQAGKRKKLSFRVRVKRIDKSLCPKRDIEILLAEQILGKYGDLMVDLINAELSLYCEIHEDFTFIFYNMEKGQKGLPSGSNPPVLALLSGGFDSPVATWKIMRRGAEVIFVHFHSYPSTSLASKENVREIIKILTQYQFYSKAYFVPFLDIQKSIMLNCEQSFGVILYRRFMMRIAEKIAKNENAKALITGDSLGQVASQTLENIAVVSSAIDLPILRPLIGENKEDIIKLSQEIGTFDISSRPVEDCCSLFVPKHPKTKARVEDVMEMEKKLDIDELIRSALDKTEAEIFDI
ncbi:MAG: putative tRNA sulfurtransferase, partial [Candidatus Moranbacteria bacterium GW2011_GWF2_37_7]